MNFNKNSNMNEIPQRAPIVCPQCGSKEIAIIAEIHKNIGARVLFGLVCLVTLSLFFVDLKNTLSGGNSYIALVIVFAVLSFLILVWIWVNESRSHSKAICRDCGYIWLID